jgi:orotate phosphoribosyltransferase
MDYRQRLLALLVERSLKLGDFTLSSGVRSPYYIDARRTTMSAEGQFLIGQVGYALIRGASLHPTHVGGLTMGADPVAYAISHRSWIEGHPLGAFSVRKAAKRHGTGQRIEGGLPRKADVLVVEDCITTGSSALDAVGALQEHGAAVLGVLSLVDREEGGRARIEEAGFRLLTVFSAAELLALTYHPKAF